MNSTLGVACFGMAGLSFPCTVLLQRPRGLSTMGTKEILVTILIALTFFGCKESQQTSAANSGEGSGVDAASSGGTRKVYITDPTLNGMNAFSVTIPSTWHFQGVLYQGGSCASVPFGVFRASSPDGLSSVERLPALGWIWGTGPMIGFMRKNDCLPMKGPMSAQEFLKYLAATMKLQYVADEPVPPEINAKAQKALQAAEAVYAPKYAASHSRPPKTTRELAWASVRSQNGSFTMNGLLKVMVECVETVYPGMKSMLRGMPYRLPSTIDKCTAGVTYFSAPENQFASLVSNWDSQAMGGRVEEAWVQAWIQRNTQQARKFMDQMNRNTQAQMQASARQFSHDQAVRQQMHEDFMATMRRGTDMSMARTQASMNARSTATSDWVDYALDRKTVMDPHTGQVNKVSSSYNNTWVDSSGKTSYQTNDVNANPNGVLPGIWTKQQVVHGNGAR